MSANSKENSIRTKKGDNEKVEKLVQRTYLISVWQTPLGWNKKQT